MSKPDSVTDIFVTKKGKLRIFIQIVVSFSHIHLKLYFSATYVALFLHRETKLEFVFTFMSNDPRYDSTMIKDTMIHTDEKTRRVYMAVINILADNTCMAKRFLEGLEEEPDAWLPPVNDLYKGRKYP